MLQYFIRDLEHEISRTDGATQYEVMNIRDAPKFGETEVVAETMFRFWQMDLFFWPKSLVNQFYMLSENCNIVTELCN
jgi:hypothetical protein